MASAEKWWWFTLFLVAGALLYLLAPVLTPFLVGAILAYMGDPLVDRLEAWKFSRTGAVLTVFLAIIVLVPILLVVMVSALEQQMTALVARLPTYLDGFQQHILPWLQAHVWSDLELDVAALKQAVRDHWGQVGGAAAQMVGSVTRSGLALVGWLANLVLIPLVTFYLLRDWDCLMSGIRDLLPRTTEPVVIKLAKECDEVLGGFLRGQLLVMVALGVLYAVGLWLIGLDLAVLIGAVAGLVSFVPYLGFIIGVLMASTAALVQFQEGWPVLWVVMVFGVAQIIESMVLTPLLVGDRIGLHPLGVIFAVMAGGQLFGFFGVLLALPVAAVVMVVVRYGHERYLDSAVYSEPTSPERRP